MYNEKTDIDFPTICEGIYNFRLHISNETPSCMGRMPFYYYAKNLETHLHVVDKKYKKGAFSQRLLFCFQ